MLVGSLISFLVVVVWYWWKFQGAQRTVPVAEKRKKDKCSDTDGDECVADATRPDTHAAQLPTVGGAKNSCQRNATKSLLDETSSDGGQTESQSQRSEPTSLPMCPLDLDCQLVNDPRHYTQFVHTCKLFPCYHAHLQYHAAYFVHSEAQVVRTRRLTDDAAAPQQRMKVSAKSQFSKHQLGATLIIVHFRGGQYPVYANWRKTFLHTFRRHLAATLFIEPTKQLLQLDSGEVLDDDMEYVSSLGVRENASVLLRVKDDL